MQIQVNKRGRVCHNVTPCPSCGDGTFIFFRRIADAQVLLICNTCGVGFGSAAGIEEGNALVRYSAEQFNELEYASRADIAQAGLEADIDLEAN